MSEPVTIALIIAIPPTIAAVAALIVGIRNGQKQEVIHSLVNSNLARVMADLKIALDRVDKLEKIITQKGGSET